MYGDSRSHRYLARPRMPRALVSAGLAALLLGATGCYNTILIASPRAHVTTLDAGEGQWFQARTKNNFRFWGISPRIRVIEVDRVVSQHLGRDVTRIDGLRVIQVTTFLDGLLNAITFGIYNPRTLIIQGKIPPPPREETEPARLPASP